MLLCVFALTFSKPDKGENLLSKTVTKRFQKIIKYNLDEFKITSRYLHNWVINQSSLLRVEPPIGMTS